MDGWNGATCGGACNQLNKCLNPHIDPDILSGSSKNRTSARAPSTAPFVLSSKQITPPIWDFIGSEAGVLQGFPFRALRFFQIPPQADTGTYPAFTHPNRATHCPLYTSLCTGELTAIRKQKCFICCPFYGRACRWAVLGEIKP